MNRGVRHFLPLFLIAIALGSILPTYSYYQNYEALIADESLRLVEIGSLAARILPLEDFEKVKQGYLAQDATIAQSEAFLRLKKTLRSVQLSQRMESDLAVFIRPEWKRDHMVYVAMGAEKSYIGNGLPLGQEARKAWDERRPTAKIWSDDQGERYLTGYVPVMDEKGAVQAVVQTDRTVEKGIHTVRSRWFLETLFSLLGWTLAATVISWVWNRSRKKSIRKLRDAIFAAFPKEKLPFSALAEDSEETLASALFTHTHGLREQSETLSKENKQLLQQKGLLESQFTLVTGQLCAIESGAPSALVAFNSLGTAVWCTKTFSEWLGQDPINTDIGVLFGCTGKDFEMAFDSVFTDPTELPSVLSAFPQNFQSSDQREYHLNYQIHPTPTDKDGRWLFVALTPAAHEKELNELVEESVGLISLLKAAVQFPEPLRRLVDILKSWTSDAPQKAYEEALVLSRVCSLPIEQAFEKFLNQEEAAERNLAHEANRLINAFAENLENLPVEDENAVVSLEPRVSFWKKYVDELSRFFGKSTPEIEMTGTALKAKWGIHSETLSALRAALRNAVEHGIETDTERAVAGKPVTGKVSITWDSFHSASNEAWCIVRIADDGRGIDPSVLREELRSFAIDASRDTNHSVLQHLFEKGVAPGARPEWERNTGLSHLAEALNQINGTYEIDSTTGRGTTLTVMFPLEKPTVLSKDVNFLSAA